MIKDEVEARNDEALILIIIIMSVLFILWKDSREIEPFLFANTEDPLIVDWEQYIWLITSRLNIMIPTWHWRRLANNRSKEVIGMYLVILVGDLFDHLMNYNTPYFGGPDEWFTYNIISVSLFAGFIIWRRIRKDESWRYLEYV